jgi:cardiolipin synthase (CMP-forming)
MRHLPNILTSLRLAAMPLVAKWLLAAPFTTLWVVYFFICITDWFDGYLARRFHWTSRFGSIADPIADKLLLVISYACLGWRGEMPSWLVALVLGRDAAILLFAGLAYAFTKLRDFPPSQWGKISTAFQMLAVGAILFVRAGADRALGLTIPLGPFFALAAAFTAISGVHYLTTGIQRLRHA